MKPTRANCPSVHSVAFGTQDKNPLHPPANVRSIESRRTITEVASTRTATGSLAYMTDPSPDSRSAEARSRAEADYSADYHQQIAQRGYVVLSGQPMQNSTVMTLGNMRHNGVRTLAAWGVGRGCNRPEGV